MIVNDGVVYSVPILPESPQQLNRIVEIHDKAALKSDVFGKSVVIGKSCFVGGSVFGDSDVVVGPMSEVVGNVICKGRVTLSEGCKVGGTIVSSELTLGTGSVVHGAAITKKLVELDDKSIIESVVLCTEGDIRLGSKTRCADAISGGKLGVGQGSAVDDAVILAHESIECADGTMVGGKRPRPINYLHGSKPFEYEINANVDKSALD